MDKLNEVLARLKKLQEETSENRYAPKSAQSIMFAFAEFANDLPELLDTLEDGIIEAEETKEKYNDRDIEKD